MPINIDSLKKWNAVIPKNDISDYQITHEGIRIVAEGYDPQLEIMIDPRKSLISGLFKKKRKPSKYLYQAISPSQHLPLKAINKRPEPFNQPYPLIAIDIDPANLFHPDHGLISNKHMRGREWEKPATVSYYENGNELFSSNVGLRIHGGKRLLLSNSYRLYFRNAYGKEQFDPGLLFSPRTEPLRRLVVHHTDWPPGWPLNNIFAYEIARKMGCIAPEVKLAHLFLNGEDQGLFFLTPHQGDTQLASFFGHEEFNAFRLKSTLKGASVAFYEDDYLALFRSTNEPLDLALIDKKIDIENLTRHLFSFVYCATSDYCQGVIARDNRSNNSKIFWINWDMDNSFIDVSKTIHGKKHVTRKIWQQAGWGRFLAETNTYCKRKDLFKRLVEEHPQYKQQVVSTTLEILNHHVTKPFLRRLADKYEKLLKKWGDYDEDYFQNIKDFFKHRHAFLIADMPKWFDLSPGYQCRVFAPKGFSYSIDGFTKEGVYEGYYFDGMEINLSATNAANPLFSHWLINGEKRIDTSLAIPVNKNLVISLVFKSK